MTARKDLAEAQAWAGQSGKAYESPPNCQACPRLVNSRKAIVQGYGPLPAQVMVVAQNPGREEEVVGRPLVGWSGKVLRERLLPLAGIDPETVRYENIVRCRPPKKPDGSGDSVPTAAEDAACRGYLWAAIEAARPDFIITLGQPALSWFFPKLKLSACHGRAQEWEGTQVVPSYHPAAATPNRRPELLKVMQEDWRSLNV